MHRFICSLFSATILIPTYILLFVAFLFLVLSKYRIDRQIMYIFCLCSTVAQVKSNYFIDILLREFMSSIIKDTAAFFEKER